MQGNVVDFDRKILICDPLQYTSSTKLRKIALMCIASHCKDQEISKIRESFISLDSEGKGSILIQQLKANLNINKIIDEKTLDKFIEAMDLNHNGSIEYTEFIASMINSDIYLNQQKIVHSFNILDKNRNGKISASDLQHIFGEKKKKINKIYQEMLSEVNCSDKTGLNCESFAKIIQSNQLIT